LLLQSDVVRDEAAPTTTEPDGLEAGRYSPSARAEVYRTMLERAGSGLRSGTDVILDATFTESWMRTAVEDLAASCHARLQVLRCEVPESVALQRLTRRVRGADTRSEADALVYRKLAENTTTWPAAQAIDTSVDIEEAYNQVEQFIR
jgi:predicted kinase